MPTLIMLRGLPGAGKSTWAMAEVAKRPQTAVRVNKDDIRSMMGPDFVKSNEFLVLQARDALIWAALARGKDVIVDDTNFNPTHEDTLRSIAETHGAKFLIRHFDTDIEECIARDAKRDKPVGEQVIRGMYEQSLKNKVMEFPWIGVNKEGIVAYIFDMDGTLADLNGRNPFDASTCEADLPKRDVIHIAKELFAQHNKIVITSGREDKYHYQTTNWLKAQGIQYEDIFMRKTGDSRKDAIIKMEIYRDLILPKYNIRGVFDDRNQVVDMWRAIGLTCFQVAPGAF